jgi:uncharacterized membrane protein
LRAGLSSSQPHSAPPAASPYRIAYLDWARGLACLLMFQTHCYDAWLSDAARQTSFFHWTREFGSLPAPLFLFLAGVAVALVCDRAIGEGASAGATSRAAVRRGAQIFGLALLFRLQEFALGQPAAPWTDLLRVDVLNIIAISLILLGLFFAIMWRGWDSRSVSFATPDQLAKVMSRFRMRSALAASAVAGGIALVTPPLWTTMRPRWLPWFLESYINGVHIFDQPQPYLFALFPWAAFAFAGFTTGCFLVMPWARRRELRSAGIIAVTGAGLLLSGLWFDSRPQFYAVYDFWHTSPNYFLVRIGFVSLILLAGCLWCRRVPSLWGFNPVIELGKQSLLVYWVSVELAYGGLSIVKKHAQTILSASAALLVLTLAMVALAAWRNRSQGRARKAWLTGSSPTGATA